CRRSARNVLATNSGGHRGPSESERMIPEFASNLLSFLPEWMQATTWYGVVALVLFVSIILMMAFLTLIERRVIGAIQARIGPNRVGFKGIGQPFADVIKLLVKEIIIPSN